MDTMFGMCSVGPLTAINNQYDNPVDTWMCDGLLTGEALPETGVIGAAHHKTVKQSLNKF